MIDYLVDTDGVVTLVIDFGGAPTNVMNPVTLRALYEALERAIEDSSVRAILLASAKDDFIAGADLRMVMDLEDAADVYRRTLELQRHLRRLETCGKPVAAAINGSALGGGFEICLACHHRVAADRAGIQLGLPEVTLGLLPGGGGTQRLSRLIGVKAALPLLLEGRRLDPSHALQAGIIDEVVPDGEERAAARRWLVSKIGESVAQPWDLRGFCPPGGEVQTPGVRQLFTVANALTHARTLGNYPAPQQILACVYEGLQADFEAGCRNEARRFAALATSGQAKDMIRTLFFHMSEVNKLARRPSRAPQRKFGTVGVIGAGLMGAGIALAQARAGIDTVLLDTSLEIALKGRDTAARLLQRDVERGRLSEAGMSLALDRIVPTVDYADLRGCELVIEAVFEDREIKVEVVRQVAAVADSGLVLASNTSTLPISELAAAFPAPDRFIGLHFFSPVDRMKLVEVITGRQTSEETLAAAMDYVRQVRKTPIVVNDSRGFYTSRVFSTYVREGLLMLAEGVAPALIENAGRRAGMPVGPLAVADDVGLDTILRVNRQAAADLGAGQQPAAAGEVIETMVGLAHRQGRKCGAGFYDYPQGTARRLWPGLGRHFMRAAEQPAVDSLVRRLLLIQSVEAARCMMEGVVGSQADADVGALLGWGFPVSLGGPVGRIQSMGLERFRSECALLAAIHGARFRPPDCIPGVEWSSSATAV